jgi:hypothetical protein
MGIVCRARNEGLGRDVAAKGQPGKFLYSVSQSIRRLGQHSLPFVSFPLFTYFSFT